jgi:flagellar biosynthesis/type III secretory pathway protein FliH
MQLESVNVKALDTVLSAAFGEETPGIVFTLYRIADIAMADGYEAGYREAEVKGYERGYKDAEAEYNDGIRPPVVNAMAEGFEYPAPSPVHIDHAAYREGFDAGFTSGQAQADDAYNAGYDDGYDDGFSDGSDDDETPSDGAIYYQTVSDNEALKAEYDRVNKFYDEIDAALQSTNEVDYEDLILQLRNAD